MSLSQPIEKSLAFLKARPEITALSIAASIALSVTTVAVLVLMLTSFLGLTFQDLQLITSLSEGSELPQSLTTRLGENILQNAALLFVAVSVIIALSITVDTLISIMILKAAQGYTRKKESFNELLEFAKEKFWNILKTVFLYFFIVLAVFSALFALGAALILIHPLLVIIGVLLLIPLLFAFLYAGLSLFVLVPVVLFENVSGWTALKQAFNLGKNHLGLIIFTLIALAVATFIVNILTGAIELLLNGASSIAQNTTLSLSLGGLNALIQVIVSAILLVLTESTRYYAYAQIRK